MIFLRYGTETEPNHSILVWFFPCFTIDSEKRERTFEKEEPNVEASI